MTPTNKVNSKNSIEKNEETKSSKFPIDVIIKNSNKRKSQYVLDNKFTDKAKQIPAALFKKYLANYSIKNIKDFEIEFDENSRYYYFDFIEFPKFVLFSIIHNDEVGYDNYYNYTYDKKSAKIIDGVMIASVGGDGGHDQYELLFYSTSLKDLLVKTKSEYDEDLFDEEHKNCYTRLSDIYETKYIFEQSNTKIIAGKPKTFKDTICQ